MERITLAQAYDLSIINFLNDLAYIKDKAAEDKRIHEEWLMKMRSKGSY
jgi:hypothetical protein